MKSNVSRAVYQKVAEENKRLKRQLRILCMEPGVDAIRLRMELRDKFKKEDGINRVINTVLKEAAREYFKDHPELLCSIYKRKHEEKDSKV